MSEFKEFSITTNTAFKTMMAKDTTGRNLFVVDISGDELYTAYLAAFPEGSNPMFKERTEHDCSTCRNFVKNIGGVILIEGDKVHTVWDNPPKDAVYSVVSKAMAKLVKKAAIKAPFVVSEPKYGALTTRGTDGVVWNHFCADVPSKYLRSSNRSNVVGERTDDVAILRRSVTEITDAAISSVLELIDQNSLYRGAEHRGTVAGLQKIKADYALLKNEAERARFLWATANQGTRFRNTVIGTLLCDLSDDVELDRAVASFEAKVAPTNYKRTTALVTQKMIDAAKKVVEDLGIEDSLARRYAHREDVSVNNVLFVDGSVKPTLIGGVFDNVKPTQKAAQSFKAVDTVSVEKFLKDILPKADTVELFVKNNMIKNFVSLIAPAHAAAKPLFKWDNGFSWSYDGEVTDSIKERVKAAGGKVDGDVRVSLSWHNGDDLDLSIKHKNNTLYFGCKSLFGAKLDVDMNAGSAKNKIDPVENIVWNHRNTMLDGVYDIYVHNFNQRSTSDVGYEVEVEILGQVYTFTDVKGLRGNERVKVGSLRVNNKTQEVTVEGNFVEGHVAMEKWGVQTEEWTPVDMVMLSPNFWDDQKVGNEHLFFMLRDCKNPEGTRGFYNEFLRAELHEHRKTFELLANSMKVGYDEDQLSGIGISTTKKEEVLVRVKGSINRVINVVF